MVKLLLNLILLSLLSCSTIHFKSENIIDVSLDERDIHTKDIEVKVEKDFFLLGMFPKHEIFVDKEFANVGVQSVSSLEITQSNHLKNTLWTIFTFGFYYPKTYIIKAKSTDG